MSNYKNIQEKLKNFIKKYYFNKLIRGSILFVGFGLLYFIFTIFIEYFLWLNPFFRTLLFWLFVVVELGFLLIFIVSPMLGLYGLKRGLSNANAARIIGGYFPEIKDKLLNIIQLQKLDVSSELIEASIEQKSVEIKPFKFGKAVTFASNKKYIKVVLLPMLFFVGIYVSGKIKVFNSSVNRVVHHNKSYQPPAPFYFNILNDSLNVVEGADFKLRIETRGDVIPDDVAITFQNENYFLNNVGLAKFEYNFSQLKEPLSFYLTSNTIRSKNYRINTIPAPVVGYLKMVLKYPLYTQKKAEVILNTGNAVVLEGTEINWQLDTHKTDLVTFKEDSKESVYFENNSTNYFSYSKPIYKPFQYKIQTSNNYLTNHETLNFSINVIKDAFPKIKVIAVKDSINGSNMVFYGQLSDDYGLKRLQLVYTPKSYPKTPKKVTIPITKGLVTDFYVKFPEGFDIQEGEEYNLYFEVFDNDAVNGNKKTRSSTFYFYNQTQEELKETMLQNQQEMLSKFSQSFKNSTKQLDALKAFKKSLQKKATIQWNDTKKLENYIKQQQKYEQLLNNNSKKLRETLSNQPDSPKKKSLEKRLKELEELTQKEDILKELNELTEKFNKEDIVKKLDKLTRKNAGNQKSLERILELTRRFYVEQKANQIQEKLLNLAEEQKDLIKQDSVNNAQNQKLINNAFDEIKKDFNELKKQNANLERPMKFPDEREVVNAINKDLEEALDLLHRSKKDSAKPSQKNAAKNLQKLSKNMQQELMQMEGEAIDESIDDLRKIVENLIEFSFWQENLLIEISKISNAHPNFAASVKRQHLLKENFEHIDDSLYVLSLRMVQMSSKIQKDVLNVHDNIDKALINFTENKLENGLANQQFAITSANNLANDLSNLLENLLNASAKMNGSGNSGSFALPDIIKRQEGIVKKVEQGLSKGKNGEDSEILNADLYEVYKQQKELREVLERLLSDSKQSIQKASEKEILNNMQEIEIELIEQGFNKNSVEKMITLNYELLKLDTAKKEQGIDDERSSNTTEKVFNFESPVDFNFKKEYLQYNEILNRQSLPLRSIYKEKVRSYFNKQKVIYKNDSI